MSFDDLRLPSGTVDLMAIPTNATPGFEAGKRAGKKALAAMGPELADLQERLFAARSAGSTRNVLLVLQGMDTSGKGGVLRHTVGLVDPQGVRITSFKAPTDEEKKHDFLWRIRNALPAPGYVGVFDRSHYEDVLIVKVHGWAPAEEIERRYGAINDFEAELVASGTVVVKCMLHVSADEQKERLLARLDERALWPRYRDAYEVALERTNTDVVPWHVIPSDRKWYRNLAIGHLLLEALRSLELGWPAADFDVETERRRLADEAPIA